MAPNLVCAHVRAMEGYAPAEQPAPGERVIKLNANENPFPPSARVLSAIRDAEPEMLRRYPDSALGAFCKVAARTLGGGISDEMIACGNGADDVLAIAMRTFVGHGGKLAAPAPSYPMFQGLAQREDATFIAVDWDKKWALPIDALLQAKPDAIFLANPNNPSGTWVAPAQIEKLVKAFDGLLLIDEAFVEYAEDNCLPLVKEYQNVLIVRSFSKSYSLAGMRFGYAIAQPPLIDGMRKVMLSYNVSTLAGVAAAAALEDQEHARMTWQHVRDERTRVASELSALGWETLPSHANFILTAPRDGRGKEMYQGLKRQGILVRHFEAPGLSDKIRITIGTSQENNALLGGIKTLSTSEKAA